MSYLAIKNTTGNQTLSGSEYIGLVGGTHKLCIRTGTGENDIVKYGLTTNTSATEYCRLKLNVSNTPCYIAKTSVQNTTKQTTTSSKYETQSSSSTISTSYISHSSSTIETATRSYTYYVTSTSTTGTGYYGVVGYTANNTTFTQRHTRTASKTTSGHTSISGTLIERLKAEQVALDTQSMATLRDYLNSYSSISTHSASNWILLSGTTSNTTSTNYSHNFTYHNKGTKSTSTTVTGASSNSSTGTKFYRSITHTAILSVTFISRTYNYAVTSVTKTAYLTKTYQTNNKTSYVTDSLPKSGVWYAYDGNGTLYTNYSSSTGQINTTISETLISNNINI